MPDVAAAGLAPSEAIGGPSTPTGAPTLSVPGSSAPSLQAQGVPADEASAIGSAAAAVGSVAAGVASAARSTEAVKDAAKSAASKAKVPDSDNVEE